MNTAHLSEPEVNGSRAIDRQIGPEFAFLLQGVHARLEAAVSRAADARRLTDLGRAELAIAHIMDIEPVLFEAQSLLEALIIVGRSRPDEGFERSGR